MRANSLAFRLIATSAGWSVLVLAITGFILSSLFRGAVEHNFDAQLEIFLDGVINNVEIDREGKLAEVSDMGVVRFNLPFSGWYWQVSEKASAAGSLASLSLLDQRIELPAGAAAPAGKLRRLYLAGPERKSIRVIEHQTKLVGSEKIYSFIVAGNPEELELAVSDFNRALMIALGLVGVGLIIAVFLQVRFGLRPLRLFRAALARIRAGKQERLTDTYPEEIKPLASELNALLSSNEEIIERSRTHVGNLAHALKTPLSVITNEAQTGKSKSAKKVAQQAGIMRDQINLYLDRARMAAHSRVIGSITEIAPVVSSLMRTLKRIHAERNIKATIKGTGTIKFRGERQDLEEMLGNLLDNAFKWAKGEVRVSAGLSGAEGTSRRVEFTVEDDGPGLPVELRADALKRGGRIDETKPGSGLGLSIVTELAALYDGEVELSEAKTGGLQVVLRLPAV